MVLAAAEAMAEAMAKEVEQETNTATNAAATTTTDRGDELRNSTSSGRQQQPPRQQRRRESTSSQQSFLSRLGDSLHLNLDDEVSSIKDIKEGSSRPTTTAAAMGAPRRGSMMGSVSRHRRSSLVQRRSSIISAGNASFKSNASSEDKDKDGKGGGGRRSGGGKVCLRRSSIVEVDSDVSDDDEVSLLDDGYGCYDAQRDRDNRSWGALEDDFLGAEEGEGGGDRNDSFSATSSFLLDDYNESFRNDTRFKEVDGMIVLTSMTNDREVNSDRKLKRNSRGGSGKTERRGSGDSINMLMTKLADVATAVTTTDAAATSSNAAGSAKVKHRRPSFQDMMGGLTREL